MPQDPHAQADHLLLDMIEQSPVGAVPRTTFHQDALKHLYATHQVYAHADYHEGHVTARSLAKAPSFRASNWDQLVAGSIQPHELEANVAVFDRYVQSLPESRRGKAETFRLAVAGRPPMHRAKHVGDVKTVAHDSLHALFLVPGSGPQLGLPGNYLYGYAYEDPVAHTWAVQVFDSDHDGAILPTASLQQTLAQVQEVMEIAPFSLEELASLGFALK